MDGCRSHHSLSACTLMLQECFSGMCMDTPYPRSLLVHVTHQSAVCLPQWGSRGRAEECSPCAIPGYTGCSGRVTTAVHGMCVGPVYVYGLWMQACVLCVYLCSADAQVFQLPTSGQRPLACNCKWMEPLWESEPIYCPGNLSINGQPLASVCHCLTLSGHFKLVLISHSQV